MKKSLVSICIPTYNRPDYLLKALKSCFNQTYKHYEIIILDNSTNNRTRNVVKKLTDKRIKYYKNEKNIGSYRNIVKIMEYPKGEYIKFLLDDDLLHKSCLESMVAIMKENETVGVVMSPLQIIDRDDYIITPKFYIFKKMNLLYKYLNTSKLISGKKILKDYLTNIYPCAVPTGIMFRKECFEKLGNFDEKYEFIIDIEMWMRFATKYDFYYLNEILSSWRYSSSSETVSVVHGKGINLKMFYFLTENYWTNKNVVKLFSNKEKDRLIKNSYFFSSKRTLINGLAAIRKKNMPLLFKTFMTIWRNDPYLSNKLKLPFDISREIFVAMRDSLLH